LLGLGSARALVVTADDGIDELSISSRTRVIEVSGGGTEEWFVSPDQLGIEGAPLEAVAGGLPEENAAAARAILAGEAGPRRELAVLNAGAAIFVGGRADDLAAGIEAAREAIDSGSAEQVLERLVATTRGLAAAG